MRNNSPSLVVPYIISISIHVVFFAWVLLSPAAKPELPFKRDQVLDVSMVSMEEVAPATKKTVTPKKAAKESEPPKAKVKPPKKDTVAIPDKPEPEVKKTVSIAPKKPKVKTSLKKQTLKPKKVKKPEAPKPDPKSEVFKRLQEKVRVDEASGRYNLSSNSSIQGSRQGSGSSAADRQMKELIEMYQQEVARMVEKNWAFNQQLAGANKKLFTALYFRVMPDGKIIDITITQRSGNQYLDDAAYKAVIKTNPAPPFYKGMIEAAIVMGLRFSPEGVR